MLRLKIELILILFIIARSQFSTSNHLAHNRKADLPVTVNSRINWGVNSIFNSNILLDAAESDTIYHLKKRINSLTGIPILSQRLYLITNGNIDYNKGQLAGNTTLKQINTRSPQIPTTKADMNIEFQLDLAAPHLPLNIKLAQASVENLSELLALQQRIALLLQKSLYIKKNWESYKNLSLEQLSEKLCFENFDTHHVNLSNYINQKNKILKGIKPGEEKEVEADATPRPLVINLFEDYPLNNHNILNRIKEIIAIHLFSDFKGLLKFIILSQLLRTTGDYCDEVNAILKVAPIALFISQTRCGSMSLKVVIKTVPWKCIPRGLLHVFPAPRVKSLL